MKSQSYMTRALKARDPRFARILGRLGYETAALAASSEATIEPVVVTDIAVLRAEYERVMGKRPFNGWDASELRKRMTVGE